MSMFWPDFIIFAVIVLSIVISFFRGFIKECLSLVTWILSAWFAYLLAKPLSSWITFIEAPSLKTLIAFFILFLVFLFIGTIINFIVSRLVRKTPFSLPDRILGIGFGLVRGVAVVALVIFFLGLTPLPQEAWWQSSFSVTKFEKGALWMKGLLPESMGEHFEFSQPKAADQDKESVHDKNKDQEDIDVELEEKSES